MSEKIIEKNHHFAISWSTLLWIKQIKEVILAWLITDNSHSYVNLVKIIRDALGDLVPFVQFKKCEKHPWRSVTFSESNTHLQGRFPHFRNCTNSTKLCKASQIQNLFVDRLWWPCLVHITLCSFEPISLIVSGILYILLRFSPE